jgi:hypothetical protein
VDDLPLATGDAAADVTAVWPADELADGFAVGTAVGRGVGATEGLGEVTTPEPPSRCCMVAKDAFGV